MRDWRSKTDKSTPTKYVENYFAKPKEFRGVATRYDKNGRQLCRIVSQPLVQFVLRLDVEPVYRAALFCRVQDVILADGGDGFQCHVTACDRPLVVLLQHQRTDEASDGWSAFNAAVSDIMSLVMGGLLDR